MDNLPVEIIIIMYTNYYDNNNNNDNKHSHPPHLHRAKSYLPLAIITQFSFVRKFIAN